MSLLDTVKFYMPDGTFLYSPLNIQDDSISLRKVCSLLGAIMFERVNSYDL